MKEILQKIAAFVFAFTILCFFDLFSYNVLLSCLIMVGLIIGVFLFECKCVKNDKKHNEDRETCVSNQANEAKRAARNVAFCYIGLAIVALFVLISLIAYAQDSIWLLLLNNSLEALAICGVRYLVRKYRKK